MAFREKDFIRIAHPDTNGFSDWITRDILQDECGMTGNGNIRENEIGPYKVECKTPKDDPKLAEDLKNRGYPAQGKARIAVRTVGYAESLKNNTIPTHIRKLLKKNDYTCSRDGRNDDLQLDHKDGRKDNPLVINSDTVCLGDFQPLCRKCNLEKREDCKQCKQIGQRPSASKLARSLKQYIFGSKAWNDSIRCCGCYWYDPKLFSMVATAPYGDAENYQFTTSNEYIEHIAQIFYRQNLSDKNIIGIAKKFCLANIGQVIVLNKKSYTRIA